MTDYDAIVRAASLILADKPDDLKLVMARMDESALPPMCRASRRHRCTVSGSSVFTP